MEPPPRRSNLRAQLRPLPAEACVAPACPALADMRRPPRWRQCWTTSNLESFIVYCNFYATEEELEELLKLPVVYHRGAMDGIVTRVPIGLQVKKQWVALPQATCNWQGCMRCEHGVSGFAFYWVDERWTPECSLDLTMTKNDHEHERHVPFPRGVLKPPQPARSPDAPASSSADPPRLVFW